MPLKIYIFFVKIYGLLFFFEKINVYGYFVRIEEILKFLIKKVYFIKNIKIICNKLLLIILKNISNNINLWRLYQYLKSNYNI